MQYFVILTKECNLSCTYCGGGSVTPPREVQYSVEDLKAFLSQDADAVVEFYGGEPLLRIGTMAEIMETVPGRFAVQTNGLFLDRVEPPLLHRLHTILVSVDGTREVTDRERGKGVYDRVMRNAALARSRGFRGDLVARMTVTQGSNVFDNVMHLLGTRLFDHVHWQLSFSMFWDAGEDNEPGLSEWVHEYNSGVSSLVTWWLDEMRRSGRVAGIVPFIGVVRTLLSGEKSKLRCGSGIDFFAIMPDGRISACPVAVDFDFSMVGSLRESTPGSLRDAVLVGEPCTSCDVLDVCGGRCLLVNKSQILLRKDGYASICSTVRHLVAQLETALPEVEAMIRSGAVRRSEFDYPEFNNGCEIIP
ncbi:MAG TPA: TIGR04084 family radical SAM/SPASM domain-containing protein [Nitrososphaerales archaeon]|nr:TIGR04084 family radical SAM/SPASM domain-containing protein [Nitrososphaerales archaeon]